MKKLLLLILSVILCLGVFISCGDETESSSESPSSSESFSNSESSFEESNTESSLDSELSSSENESSIKVLDYSFETGNDSFTISEQDAEIIKNILSNVTWRDSRIGMESNYIFKSDSFTLYYISRNGIGVINDMENSKSAILSTEQTSIMDSLIAKNKITDGVDDVMTIQNVKYTDDNAAVTLSPEDASAIREALRGTEWTRWNYKISPDYIIKVANLSLEYTDMSEFFYINDWKNCMSLELNSEQFAIIDSIIAKYEGLSN